MEMAKVTPAAFTGWRIHRRQQERLCRILRLAGRIGEDGGQWADDLARGGFQAQRQDQRPRTDRASWRNGPRHRPVLPRAEPQPKGQCQARQNTGCQCSPPCRPLASSPATPRVSAIRCNRPPSTSRMTPVRKLPGSAARNSVASAMSLGVERRPIGTLAMNCARFSGVSCPMKLARSGVSPATGAMALTRNAVCRQLNGHGLGHQVHTAPLEALYQTRPGRGRKPAVEPDIHDAAAALAPASAAPRHGQSGRLTSH